MGTIPRSLDPAKHAQCKGAKNVKKRKKKKEEEESLHPTRHVADANSDKHFVNLICQR